MRCLDGELRGFGASLDLACRCLDASYERAYDIFARDPPLQGVLVVGEDGQPVVAVEHELAQRVLEVLVAEEHLRLAYVAHGTDERGPQLARDRSGP